MTIAEATPPIMYRMRHNATSSDLADVMKPIAEALADPRPPHQLPQTFTRIDIENADDVPLFGGVFARVCQCGNETVIPVHFTLIAITRANNGRRVATYELEDLRDECDDSDRKETAGDGHEQRQVNQWHQVYSSESSRSPSPQPRRSRARQQATPGQRGR